MTDKELPNNSLYRMAARAASLWDAEEVIAYLQSLEQRIAELESRDGDDESR